MFHRIGSKIEPRGTPESASKHGLSYDEYPLFFEENERD